MLVFRQEPGKKFLCPYRDGSALLAFAAGIDAREILLPLVCGIMAADRVRGPCLARRSIFASRQAAVVVCARNVYLADRLNALFPNEDDLVDAARGPVLDIKCESSAGRSSGGRGGFNHRILVGTGRTESGV